MAGWKLVRTGELLQCVKGATSGKYFDAALLWAEGGYDLIVTNYNIWTEYQTVWEGKLLHGPSLKKRANDALKMAGYLPVRK